MDIKRVAGPIHQFEVRLPGSAWITTMYLVGGDRGAVIEPGPATAIPFIREAMRSLGMKDLAYIIPSHIHLDHAGAIGGLAQMFPAAKVVLHPSAVRHAVDPARLISSFRLAFGADFESTYGPFTAVPESQIRAAEHGETLPLDSVALQVIHAPGHATHHIALFEPGSGALFCGEALGIPFPGTDHSPLPAAAPPSFDPEVYLNTLEELRRLRPGVLLYSHYGPGLDPARLIAQVAENTRIFGEMVLSGLKRGDDTEVIGREVLEHFQRYRGVTLEKVDRLILDGFIHYFKRNGLI